MSSHNFFAHPAPSQLFGCVVVAVTYLPGNLKIFSQQMCADCAHPKEPYPHSLAIGNFVFLSICLYALKYDLTPAVACGAGRASSPAP